MIGARRVFQIHHPEVLESVLKLGDDRVVFEKADVFDLDRRIVRNEIRPVLLRRVIGRGPHDLKIFGVLICQ